jgi:hypothetical protein
MEYPYNKNIEYNLGNAIELHSAEPQREIPFWINNPNILFKFDYLSDIFPTDEMTVSQNLNALSRLIIFITIIIFVFLKTTRILIIGGLSLGAIIAMYYYQEHEKHKLIEPKTKEKYENQADTVLNKLQYVKTPTIFDTSTPQNPFSNVLITDYEYNPTKKPAPPSFTNNSNNTILENAKKLVAELNQGQPNITEKLFTDLGEQYTFEQSMRQFTSNPATTIPSDQNGFAEFCYGNSISSREGNLFALARNLPRYNNY